MGTASSHSGSFLYYTFKLFCFFYYMFKLLFFLWEKLFHFHVSKFIPPIHNIHWFFFPFSYVQIHSSNSLPSFTVFFFIFMLSRSLLQFTILIHYLFFQFATIKILLLMNYFHFFAFARVGFFML